MIPSLYFPRRRCQSGRNAISRRSCRRHLLNKQELFSDTAAVATAAPVSIAVTAVVMATLLSCEAAALRRTSGSLLRVQGQDTDLLLDANASVRLLAAELISAWWRSFHGGSADSRRS